MRRTVRPIAAALVVAGAMVAILLPQGAGSGSGPPGNKVLARALDLELGRVERKAKEPLVSSGPVYALLQASGELDKRAEAVGGVGATAVSRSGTQGCRNVFKRSGFPDNIRVNQDCSLRRQAEEVVVVNPTGPSNLIAGQNDSRLGFNHCGYDWSFDGGKTWGDQVPPFWQFILSDGHTSDVCADPSATFDADGNAYVVGLLFDVVSPANALVVAKSNAGIGGAFWHTPLPLAFQTYRVDPPGVIVDETDPFVFHDKEFIVADADPGSPKKNNVYVTWTRFDLDTGRGVGANTPIFFSQSTDGGATWSPIVQISGANRDICTDFSGSRNPAACDQDQGSHPIVGPDGTIYVVFANFNTPEFGINQVLFVKCPATEDCSKESSWTRPRKVGDLIGTHPFGPDPETGCDFVSQCLPPNGYRVPEFASASISTDPAGNLYVAWADFRNGGPPCTPLGDAATADPPCNNDVFYAFSTNGGRTWSETRNATPRSRFGRSAQWQPWSTTAPDGSLLIAYYDRSYGNCEFTGCNDITLAKVTNPASSSPSFGYRRITTSSMPNLIPANNPVQAGFLGDYMWISMGGGRVHIVWGDTRGLDGTAVEEDIYYASVAP